MSTHLCLYIDINTCYDTLLTRAAQPYHIKENMKRDVRQKQVSELLAVRKKTRANLVSLLKLSGELETVYQTYPKLQSVVGHAAWQSLTDLVYQELLQHNLDPENLEVAERIRLNMVRLEDIAAASLVRDDTGLRDVLSRVLIFRLTNGLVTK